MARLYLALAPSACMQNPLFSQLWLMLLYDTSKLRYKGTLAVYTWYDYSEKVKIIKADKFTGSPVEV